MKLETIIKRQAQKQGLTIEDLEIILQAEKAENEYWDSKADRLSFTY